MTRPPRSVHVHLVPSLLPPSSLPGGLAVVVDILRASTTIVHSLAAGCRAIFPAAEIDEARRLADSLPAGKVLLAGERGGLPVSGFDLGNSPAEFTPERCAGLDLVLTTTNGTRALLGALDADRILVGAFVNFSALCEQVVQDRRPLHLICAGSEGQVVLEDVLFAGAVVEALRAELEVSLDDSSRLAWDAFENHGRALEGALEISHGGRHLTSLGYGADIALAAVVDRFALVPELRRDPLRLEKGAVGVRRLRWPHG